MKLGIKTNREQISEPQWVPYDAAGFEKNLDEPEDRRIEFLLLPQTRSVLNEVNVLFEKMKAAASRSTKLKTEEAPYDESGRLLPKVSRKGNELWIRCLARVIVKDWKNVSDDDGNLIPCDDFNKIWAFEDLNLAMWVTEKSQGLVSVAIEDEEGNSEG